MSESGIEVKRAIGSIAPGECKGNWDIKARECMVCMWGAKCEEMTKSKISRGNPQPVPAPNSMEQEPPVKPLEYLLQSMRGKYNESEQTTDGNSRHVFTNDGGDKVMVVLASSTGRVKLKTVKGERLLEKIESNEQAESIIREML